MWELAMFADGNDDNDVGGKVEKTSALGWEWREPPKGRENSVAGDSGGFGGTGNSA